MNFPANITLRKELPYFTIQGAQGSSQDWFTDPWMHLGGCAAITACDSSLYFDLYRGTRLSSMDKTHLTRQKFVRFGMEMKPYLRPRFSGIDRLDIYVEGYGRFLASRGCTSISMDTLPGECGVQEAWSVLMKQINAGMPVPCLILHHAAPAFKNYEWHWFLLTGWALEKDRPMVRAVTYGRERWLDFAGLWNTGHDRRGGLILYRFQESPQPAGEPAES